jgi:hypothetical protein
VLAVSVRRRWLNGGVGKKDLQANQIYSIVVIDQQEGSRKLALLKKHLFVQDHFKTKR